jgi:hypothetical protein
MVAVVRRESDRRLMHHDPGEGKSFPEAGREAGWQDDFPSARAEEERNNRIRIHFVAQICSDQFLAVKARYARSRKGLTPPLLLLPFARQRRAAATTS